MKYKKQLFPIAFIVLSLVAGLVHGPHADEPHTGPRACYHPDPHWPDRHASSFPALTTVTAVLIPDKTFHGTSGELPERKERRHGKSLRSQAIIADPAPSITPGSGYCQRHYSPFLPGGGVQRPTGNFSLRGPPSFA